MTLHLPRLPFSLDPLIAEAKRRARQRRMLVALCALLLVGLAVGLTLAFRPSGGGPSGELATANYPQNGVSLRYPSAWARVDCPYWATGIGFGGFLLTTGRLTQKCAKPAVGVATYWPPPERLGTNGVSLAFVNFYGAGGVPLKLRWNARIAGRPAHVFGGANGYQAQGHYSVWVPKVTCPAGGGREYRNVTIRRPDTINGALIAQIVTCGPDLAAGRAAARQVLASVRFTKPKPRS